MTESVGPGSPDETVEQAGVPAPRVAVLITYIPGADLGPALAAVRRQVYEPADVVVVAPDGEVPEGVASANSLEDAITGSDGSIDYLWILHSDARPRPDALSALVAEVGRNDASLGGSKLLIAGTGDQLESVGSATDVFGEPYSGLDEGEVDLQQYDVVREVAFVSSVSMLIRRDLARGLRRLDRRLEPVAAGLDFSQRVRLAGGRVIVVPSSEVYHQGRCLHHGGGWREEAGRIRAMLKAYRPLTLAWVVPFALLTAVADGLGNLLLGRWRIGARHGAAWAWNLFLLPSTIGERIRLSSMRQVGDEELFRFQASGSIVLRQLASELSDRFLSMFDDDRVLATGTRRLWASKGIIGAIVALAIGVAGLRSIFFVGIPQTGFTFPFAPATESLGRFFGGWNDAGLGSSAAVHPMVGATGAVSALFLGSETAARVMLTVGAVVAAIVGTGRLGGRLGLSGHGRYLGGLVMLAGPGTGLLTGRGSWAALVAAGILPWALRSIIDHPDDPRSRLAKAAWAAFYMAILTAFMPVAALIMVVFVVAARLLGIERVSVVLGLAGLIGAIVGLAFLVGDPGFLLDGERRLGLDPGMLWVIGIGAASLAAVVLPTRERRIAIVGSVLALGLLAALRAPLGGPGFEEMALLGASMGAALLVAAGLNVVRWEPRRAASAMLAIAFAAVSAGMLLNGRLGLPEGNLNERLGFARSLEEVPGRMLLVSEDATDLPGSARPGPGFFFRVVDGTGIRIDDVWLAPPRLGDGGLATALEGLATGSELRPGEVLAEYAINWVVILGEETAFEEVLRTQIDLIPTPLDPELRVFENELSVGVAVTDSDQRWIQDGLDYRGEPEEGVLWLGVNADRRWSPDWEQAKWANSVSTAEGVATFDGNMTARAYAVAAAAMPLLALGLAAWKRTR